MVIPPPPRYRAATTGEDAMRKLLVAALCLGAAACGGAPEEKKAEAPPALFPAGTWTMSSKITAFRSLDKTPPAIKATVGDQENATICVDKASQEPPPALFSGQGNSCTYKSAYMKDGLVNAVIDCRREDVEGAIMMTIQGNYTATGFTGTADTTAYLPGPGDFAMSRKISGSVKPGACTPAPAADAKEKSAG
jgi:Protein of unknown function (DUF3617)